MKGQRTKLGGPGNQVLHHQPASLQVTCHSQVLGDSFVSADSQVPADSQVLGDSEVAGHAGAAKGPSGT